MNAIEYIGEHPKIALLVAVFHVLAAEVLTELQIPKVIMQSFQLGAWTISIVVGVITIISWSHRIYKKYLKK